MLGNDVRLFQDTKAWELAKAVKDDDTTLIHKLIKVDKIPIEFREPRFGQTLLSWAVYTNHYKSVKALLEDGADPNLLETYSRKSALMYASDYGPDYYKGTEILKLCLKYGGNPNSVANSQTSEGYKPRETPLIIASKCCLAKNKNAH
jgi:ankyrin repeat protein